MSIQSVLLPVFVLVGLTFALLLGMVDARRRTLVSRETKVRDIALGQPNWPMRTTQLGNCYRNQFELPVLFYVLTILAWDTRHAGIVFVVLAWIFVICRVLQAYIHVTSNVVRYRGLFYSIGAVVRMIMWALYIIEVLTGVII
jgi:hypothetical protein